jgi:hypothetical protein
VERFKPIASGSRREAPKTGTDGTVAAGNGTQRDLDLGAADTLPAAYKAHHRRPVIPNESRCGRLFQDKSLARAVESRCVAHIRQRIGPLFGIDSSAR